MRIALPVEVKLRDLRGLLWLGLNLIEQGHEVIIGETFSVKKGLDIIEPDVLLWGGISKDRNTVQMCKNLKENGGYILSLDTEGGVFVDDNKFVKNCDSPKFITNLDIYFSWGKKQAELLTESTKLSMDQVIISGNPRFDLLKGDMRSIFSSDVENILREFGQYFLINTNFNQVNHPNKSKSPIDDNRYRSEQILFEKYIQMIKKLADEFPEHSIIIRPHPLEEITSYHSLLSELENVHVIRKGDVIPWILGSNVVIHNSSTTGIESAMSDTPVISYRPVDMEKWEADLPIKISEEVNHFDGIRTAINRYSEQNFEYKLTTKQTNELSNYIKNSLQHSATDIITEAIGSIPKQELLNYSGSKIEFIDRLRRASNKYIGQKNSEILSKIILGSDFSGVRQKFPGLSANELESEIIKFESCCDIRLNDLRVNKIRELRNVYELKS